MLLKNAAAIPFLSLALMATASSIMMKVVILSLLIPSCYGFLWIIGWKQSVGVKGKLVCDGEPATGVKVKLYERELFFDRKLDQAKTDTNGTFELWGSAREITKIDPQLNIYHKCNYTGSCYKKISMKVPSKYIVKGKDVDVDNVDNYFDIGIVELSKDMKDETVECIN